MALYPHPGLYPRSGLYPGGVSLALLPQVMPGHTWAVFARDTSYLPSMRLPIVSVDIVRKHVDVDTAMFASPFTPDAWDQLSPGTGVLAYRDGTQQFSGTISARQLNWDAEQGRPQITLECLGDLQQIMDRLARPDPLRAADDQTVNDYWYRDNVHGSTAMWAVISDQAGPTAYPAYQVAGLALGPDPVVGTLRRYEALFQQLDNVLQVFSVASGADLGVRVTAVSGQLRVDIVQPRDLSASVKFAADLRNLTSIFYRETAPTVTHALVAGQGDLHARVRKLEVTTDPLALQWGRQAWSYVDRRDTSDLTQLAQAGEDAIAQGAPTVSLTVTLTDTAAATYGRDYDLGDKVSVFVGLPGQNPVTTVSDVIRQIRLQVDNTGKEVITPAIGSYDAKAVRATPTQRNLADAANALNRLITHQ